MNLDSRVVETLCVGEWEKAVKRWQLVRKQQGGCAFCTYESDTSLSKCASCLEGRLLSLSLGNYSNDLKEDRYLKLARDLKKWER